MMNNGKRDLLSEMDEPVSRRTRQCIKEQSDNTMWDAMGIVLGQRGSEMMLHWSDALVLGSTCKQMRNVWKEEHEQAYLSPLLELVESMLGKCSDEWEMPPLRSALARDYDSFSVLQKCQAMVSLLGRLVHNFHSYHRFCLEDPSNPRRNVECSPDDWEMGRETETEYLSRVERRATLAITFAVFLFASSSLSEGGDYYFNDVFLGLKGGYLGGGSCYGRTMCSMISRMYPFRDEDLVKFVRGGYPTQASLDLLGPVLTEKIVLMSPLFKWVPLGSTDKNHHHLESLPTPLERLDEEIIRSHGMGVWLAPHDGIDY